MVLYAKLNLETLKEVAFLTRDYHNQYYITTTVNNLMTVLISGVRGQKSSQSLTALSTMLMCQLAFCLSEFYIYCPVLHLDTLR